MTPELDKVMKDTDAAFAAMYQARFLAMSPDERWQILASMCATARAIVAARMPAGLDATSQRHWMCEQYYGKALAEAAYPR